MHILFQDGKKIHEKKTQNSSLVLTEVLAIL